MMGDMAEVTMGETYGVAGQTNPMANISIGILAGGKSSRMGKNKALLKFENERIIARTAREMSVFDEVIISAAGKGEYEDLGLPMVYDMHKDIGPIEGIRRVLSEARGEYVFICAADMPFIKKELVSYLAEFISSDYDCYVIADDDHIQPLCAIYSKSVLPVIEELVSEGSYRLREIFKKVRTKYVPLSLSCFGSKVVRNINTREDYRELVRPVVFCVSGYSDSGKTWLVTRLINEFIKEGYSVAALKHDGHDSYTDVAGSDTAQYLESGARCSAIFSDTRHTVHMMEPTDAEELIAWMRESKDPPDVIIIEGLKGSKYPKIETLRKGVSETSSCDEDTLICIAAEDISPDNAKCPVYRQEQVREIFMCVMGYFDLTEET